MSVLVPYHRMIFPVSSRNGSTRMRNQRKTPSCRRSRASISPVSPETNSCRHFSIKGGRSSGWNAACQPQPFDSSGGEACVFVPSFVEKLVPTVCEIAPGERRYRIDHLAESNLRQLHLFE